MDIFNSFSKHYSGWLWNLLDPIGIFDSNSGVRSALSSLTDKYLGTGLTPADREANAFTADEAQKQRDWESSQADIAYQRQREFYQDFQSPQAMIQQYREAGLNPALMYGNGASVASAPSVAQGSGGASASSVRPSAGDIGQLVSLLAGIGFRAKEVQAETDLKSSQSKWYNANTDAVLNENGVFAERMQRERSRFALEQELRGKNIENVSADTKVKYALESKYLQDVDESKARKAVARMDEALKQVDLETRSDYNRACLALVQSEEKLNQAQSELAIANKYKTQSETSYMRIKVRNAQKEYDKNFEYLDAQIAKIGKDAKLTDKEIAYFRDKYNLQVISAVTGAANAAKFAPGTRFQSGNYAYTKFLDDIGYVGKQAGSNLRNLYK